jgi:chromosome partitioning protein
MKIIAPTNNKGGVGKTKVSEILAEYFSKVKGKRTLAIDLDSQCNFSQHYINMDIDPTYPQGKIPPIHPDYDPNDPDDADWNGRSSIADIYLGEPVIPYPTKINNLDIALGNSETLEEAQQVRKEELAEKVHDHLHTFLSDPAVAEEYDVIIIDTAPSKGPLTVSAIKAADHIIIPSIMEEQPIQGVYGMVQLWMQERVRRPVDRPLDLLGILPNLFRTTNLHKDMLESLQQDDHLGKYVIPHYLSQRTSFAEADVKGVSPESIFDLPNSNPAKQQAMRLCEFINERVFG